MGNQQISLPNDAKQIPNFSRYYVTPRAELFSTVRKSTRQLRCPYDKSCGYRRVAIIDDDGVKKSMLLHRLVALTFLSDTFSEDREVNHKDADKLNNNLSNLEWVTRSENLKHAYSFNLITVDGESNPRALLSEEDVLVIYQKLLEGGRNIDLAREYGVGTSTILSIKSKSSWNYLIAHLPDIPIKFKPKNLDDDVVIEICNLYQEGKTPKQIFDLYETGATMDQLYDIKRRKCFNRISKDYVW